MSGMLQSTPVLSSGDKPHYRRKGVYQYDENYGRKNFNTSTLGDSADVKVDKSSVLLPKSDAKPSSSGDGTGDTVRYPFFPGSGVYT